MRSIAAFILRVMACLLGVFGVLAGYLGVYFLLVALLEAAFGSPTDLYDGWAVEAGVRSVVIGAILLASACGMSWLARRMAIGLQPRYRGFPVILVEKTRNGADGSG